MFAANSNAIPSVCRMIIETVLDPALKVRVLVEVDACTRVLDNGSYGGPQFDFVKLAASPLLQSMYAETLRLTISNLVTRTPVGQDFHAGQWSLPEQHICFLNNTILGQAPQLWNAGTQVNPHPLQDFWADRFIYYPDDPSSGALNPDIAQNAKQREEESKDAPYFSMKGLLGGWVPYGGGASMCPGRHFAKNEMIGAVAIILKDYEVELSVPEGFKPQNDLRFYGLGGMPTKDKISFRIRRRTAQATAALCAPRDAQPE